MGATQMSVELAPPRSRLLEDLQLLGQIGAGPDGASFRAVRQTDAAGLEVRILSNLPQNPLHRAQRLQRLKRARLLEHPGATRLVEMDLGSEPPIAVLEWTERRPLADCARDRAPGETSTRSALQIARDIASAVAAAHRLGLTHDHLGPNTVWISSKGRVQIDFTGIDTTSGLTPPRTPDVGGERRLDAAQGGQFGEGTRGLQRSVAEAVKAEETLPLGGTWNPEADVAAVSSLVLWLLCPNPAEQATHTGNSKATLLTVLPKHSGGLADTLAELVDRGLSPDVPSRPSAAEIEQCLDTLLEQGRDRPDLAPSDPGETGRFGGEEDPHAAKLAPEALHSERRGSVELAGSIEGMLRDALDGSQESLSPGKMLGRFAIRRKLGEGGMGAVYEADDMASGETVAIKVLSPLYARRPEALGRFKREAKLLAGLQHPNVVNLLEVNEDDGVHYLAMEYLPGQDLKQLLATGSEMPESLALKITADVLRGLALAHERGIVHRDIKPANILLVVDGDGEPNITDGVPLAKLADFGLARDTERIESLQLTRSGMLLGTPQYMAPEQCAGEKEATPAADVYALGATLFHMLAGRPPFMASDVLELVDLHRFERPPALDTLRRDVSQAAVRIVEKALAKSPAARYQDASQMLADIQRLLRGDPTTMKIHPVLPAHDPGRVFRADFEYDLTASPEELWPCVSNTERINRAVDVPAVEYTSVRDEHGELHKYGDFRMAGLRIAWEELPFEWIEGQRLGVLREFSKGPFHWFLSIVEVLPRSGGGTRLKHSVRIAPRGAWGRLVAHLEVNIKGRPKLDKVYHRIDEVISGKRGRPAAADPFEPPRRLSRPAETRLAQRLHRVQCGETSDAPADWLAARKWTEVAERLGSFLLKAAPQALARIRPFEVARQWGAEREVVLDVCLRAAHEGLLELHWDLLCPTCRISAGVKDTLREIDRHACCEVCDLDFELDFGSSIELIFRAHPEIREADLKTYCIGGPEHSPHVVAQVRLMPEEHFELPLRLAPGTYLLRGPQLPYSVRIDVHGQSGVRQAEVELTAASPSIPVLQAGGQMLALNHSFDRPLLIRLERTILRDDVVTAAQAATRPLFGELFPHEAIDPAELLSVSRLAFLAVDLQNTGELLARLGDAKAYSVFERYRRAVLRVVKQSDGVLVHTRAGSALQAAFNQSLHAVRAGLALSKAVREGVAGESLILRAGVHSGPALVVNLDDRLDYFGQSVEHVSRLTQQAGAGELILTGEVGTDPEIVSFLQQQRVSASARSFPGEPLAQCIVLP